MGGQQVALYRCYFITVSDHVADVLELEAESDAEAVEQARAAVTRQPGRTAELWQLSRLVSRHIWPNAPGHRIAAERSASNQAA
jgi:hypothetical protein